MAPSGDAAQVLEAAPEAETTKTTPARAHRDEYTNRVWCVTWIAVRLSSDLNYGGRERRWRQLPTWRLWIVDSLAPSGTSDVDPGSVADGDGPPGACASGLAGRGFEDLEIKRPSGTRASLWTSFTQDLARHTAGLRLPQSGHCGGGCAASPPGAAHLLESAVGLESVQLTYALRERRTR